MEIIDYGYIGIIILGLLLASILIWQIRTITKEKDEILRIKRKLSRKSDLLVEKAHKQSVRILQKALKKSEEIVEKTNSIAGQVEDWAETEVGKEMSLYSGYLKNISEEILHSYKTLFEELKLRYDEDEKSFISELEETVKESKKDLEKSISKTSDEVSKMTNEFVLAESEEISLLTKAIADQVSNFAKWFKDNTIKYEAELKVITETQQSQLTKIEEKNGKTLEEINAYMTNGIKAYTNKLIENATKQEAEIEKYTQERIKQINEDLEAFRFQRENEIQEQVSSIVKKVTISVLGKSINTDEHQKLILDALDRAKIEIMK